MPEHSDGFGPVCAVIVTYRTGPEIIDILQNIIQQVGHCIVVDNGHDGPTLAALQEAQKHHNSRLEVISCPVNNLAQAQNLGITRARTLGHDWVLLLDHDSIPDPGMVAAAQQAFSALPRRERIGVIAPYVYDVGAERSHAYLRACWGPFFRREAFAEGETVKDGVLSVIASGSLIPTTLFDAVGMMDEGLVIDYVDNDFNLRLQARGYRIVAVRAARLRHRLGACKTYRLGRLRITATHHSPQRRYYIYRNRITLWRRYGLTSPAFLAYDLIATAFDLLRITLFEENKKEKFYAIFSGVAAAIRGELGPRTGGKQNL